MGRTLKKKKLGAELLAGFILCHCPRASDRSQFSIRCDHDSTSHSFETDFQKCSREIKNKTHRFQSEFDHLGVDEYTPKRYEGASPSVPAITHIGFWRQLCLETELPKILKVGLRLIYVHNNELDAVEYSLLPRSSEHPFLFRQNVIMNLPTARELNRLMIDESVSFCKTLLSKLKYHTEVTPSDYEFLKQELHTVLDAHSAVCRDLRVASVAASEVRSILLENNLLMSRLPASEQEEIMAIQCEPQLTYLLDILTKVLRTQPMICGYSAIYAGTGCQAGIGDLTFQRCLQQLKNSSLDSSGDKLKFCRLVAGMDFDKVPHVLLPNFQWVVTKFLVRHSSFEVKYLCERLYENAFQRLFDSIRNGNVIESVGESDGPHGKLTRFKLTDIPIVNQDGSDTFRFTFNPQGYCCNLNLV